MSLYRFEGRWPHISQKAYIAPSALVIGDVRIGDNCYIGHGAILRGDYGTIIIGGGSAVEEGVIIHARPDDQTIIGDRVTLGHGAMIHNSVVKDNAVIGIRATLADFSEIGQWSIIGEMTLVKSYEKIPEYKIAVGVPAQIIGDVQEKHLKRWEYGKKLYIDLARRYLNGAMQRVD